MTTRAQTSTRSRTTTPARRPRTRATGRAKDAIALLKEDHRRVEALFEQFASARKAERKQQIVATICEELTTHATLEEREFYPVVREMLRKEDHLVDEAEVEHASIKSLVSQLEFEAPDADLYDAKVEVLKEYVSHHVKEEERQIFPRLRKTDLDLATLGETMMTARQKLMRRKH